MGFSMAILSLGNQIYVVSGGFPLKGYILVPKRAPTSIYYRTFLA
jgi:hypothetical protein